MKYSHNYNKLNDIVYTTIRRYKKAKVGDKIRETYPSGTHLAFVVAESRFSLDELPLSLLQKDTDLEEWEDIFKLFQSFYKKPIDIYNDNFYLYVLVRLD